MPTFSTTMARYGNPGRDKPKGDTNQGVSYLMFKNGKFRKAPIQEPFYKNPDNRSDGNRVPYKMLKEITDSSDELAENARQKDKKYNAENEIESYFQNSLQHDQIYTTTLPARCPL